VPRCFTHPDSPRIINEGRDLCQACINDELAKHPMIVADIVPVGTKRLLVEAEAALRLACSLLMGPNLHPAPGNQAHASLLETLKNLKTLSSPATVDQISKPKDSPRSG
jgi:hypothetical protein